MTVTKAWVAGKLIEDVRRFDGGVAGNGAGQPRLASELSSSVVKQLSNAIVLNCSASLQQQQESGKEALDLSTSSHISSCKAVTKALGEKKTKSKNTRGEDDPSLWMIGHKSLCSSFLQIH